MLVSFRSCGPKDHMALLKLVIAYNKFEKIPVHRKSLSRGLDALLRNPSQGKMWLMEDHKKPVGYALLTYNFELEYGGAEGVLRDLFVEKKFRNQGVGTRESGLWRFTKSKIIAGSAVCGRSSCSFRCATRPPHFSTATRDSANSRGG